MENLRYPIGRFVKPATISQTDLENFIAEIDAFPEKLGNEVKYLSDEQLDTPYRQDGWTIRQVVHHCADSHMNSFIRFKLALTEEKPTIKPYFEDRWAEIEDSKMAVEPSIQLLAGLHSRWTVLLRSMNESQYSQKFVHPEHGREFELKEMTAIYAWHCNHHLAHITELKKRMQWN